VIEYFFQDFDDPALKRAFLHFGGDVCDHHGYSENFRNFYKTPLPFFSGFRILEKLLSHGAKDAVRNILRTA
jgi:hypothetical protein